MRRDGATARGVRLGLARALAREPELIAAFLEDAQASHSALRSAIDDALAWRDDCPELHYFAARAALETGDTARADALLERAVALRPAYTDALILSARRAAARADHAAGLALLERALAAGGDYADVHCLRGQLLDCAGDRTGALRAFERALSINPRYGEARDRMARLAERPTTP